MLHMGSSYRQMLIELRNHAHLAGSFGLAVAEEVLSQLRLRVLCLGGEVWMLDAATLLVNIPDDLLWGEARASDRLVEDWMEHWQLWLSTPVTLPRGGLRVLPVVGLSRAFRVDDAHACSAEARASTPDRWELELSPLDEVQFLAPPGRGVKWREAYARDMACAIDLYEHLAAGELSLDMQPVVHARDHSEVLYLEALLRLSKPGAKEAAGQGPTAGTASISMGDKVPALERLGLVRELDRVVVLSVLRWLRAQPMACVGCNVSALSLVGDSWWSSVIAQLRERPDVASRLTIEITETAAQYDPGVATAFVHRLQALGCRIALDDFGAGHSSFAFMQSVQPQVTKLDGSLIRAARGSRSGEQRLASLAAYCQAIAEHVVAEGIEQPQDVDRASRVGADCLQGFAIAPPAPMNPRLWLSRGCAFEGDTL